MSNQNIVWSAAIRNKVQIGENVSLYNQTLYFEYIHNNSFVTDYDCSMLHCDKFIRPINLYHDDHVYRIHINTCLNMYKHTIINIMNHMVYLYCKRNTECLECEIAHCDCIDENNIQIILYCDNENSIRQFMISINRKCIQEINSMYHKFSFFDHCLGYNVLNVVNIEKIIPIKNSLSFYQW